MTKYCERPVPWPISKWSLPCYDWVCDSHLANKLLVGVTLDPGKRQVTDVLEIEAEGAGSER